MPRGPNSHLCVPVARKSQPRSGRSTSTAANPCTPSTQRVTSSRSSACDLLHRHPHAGAGVHPRQRDHARLRGDGVQQPLRHVVHGRGRRVVVQVDAGDLRAGPQLQQPQRVLGGEEVVGGREDLVALAQGQPAVHHGDAHRGAVGQRVLRRVTAGERRRRVAHRLLVGLPGEQRVLGVPAEPVAVVGDRRVQQPGVRREDEGRELGQLRVEQELGADGVPVLGESQARGSGEASTRSAGFWRREVVVGTAGDQGGPAGQAGAEKEASSGACAWAHRAGGWPHVGKQRGGCRGDRAGAGRRVRRPEARARRGSTWSPSRAAWWGASARTTGACPRR